jgi:pyrophosphate--fructose-6-phosphate 1-phosphotransferase
MKPSQLEKERLRYKPTLPDLLLQEEVTFQSQKTKAPSQELQTLFPNTHENPILALASGGKGEKNRPLKVGVVLSGGQAAGGHNVIGGIFDALMRFSPSSQLIGFLGGPSGIVSNKTKALTREVIDAYRNTGGFDMIGSGRTKIETPEQFEAALKTVQTLSLDGLVIVGGDDSNTNAAFLAEYFLSKKCSTKVVGVPKTIDGDLKNEWIEISFGFDTACKTYCELIGNIAKDALSAKKYTHFIKLMGRSASHIALECALQTHPNLTFIGEEMAAQKKTLHAITSEIADLICKRSAAGKDYGLILVPEGLIEFIPEIQSLLKELSQTTSVATLSKEGRETFALLPEKIQHQLLLDKDPHGNVQVSHIETEALLIHMVRQELQKRDTYNGKFTPISHFFGYEGRSAFPSNFDASYCYALGMTAALLIQKGFTGYMSVISNLRSPEKEWKVGAVPLVSMMRFEERKGKRKAVVQKTLIDLNGRPFQEFAKERERWALDDDYCCPGAIQYFGPASVCEATTLTLQLETQSIFSTSV